VDRGGEGELIEVPRGEGHRSQLGVGVYADADAHGGDVARLDADGLLFADRERTCPSGQGHGGPRGDHGGAAEAAGEGLAVDVLEVRWEADGVGGAGDELALDQELPAVLVPVVHVADAEIFRARADGDLAQLGVLDRIVELEGQGLEAAGGLGGAVHGVDALRAVGAKGHGPRGVERERAVLAAQAGGDADLDLAVEGPQAARLDRVDLALLVAAVIEVRLDLLGGGEADPHRHRRAGRGVLADPARAGLHVGLDLAQVDGAVELDQDRGVAAAVAALAVAVGAVVAGGARLREGADDGGAHGLEAPVDRTVEALAVEADDPAVEADLVGVTGRGRGVRGEDEEVGGLPVGAARERRVDREQPGEVAGLLLERDHRLIEAHMNVDAALAAADRAVIEDIEGTGRPGPGGRAGADRGGVEGGLQRGRGRGLRAGRLRALAATGEAERRAQGGEDEQGRGQWAAHVDSGAACPEARARDRHDGAPEVPAPVGFAPAVRGLALRICDHYPSYRRTGARRINVSAR
jgi:hypothetical protein